MFADAVEKASAFTWPTVAAFRIDGADPQVALGAMIVVNRDGWVLTAAHNLEEIKKLSASWQARQNMSKEIEGLKTARMNQKERKNRISEIRKKRKNTISEFAIVFGSVAPRIIAEVVLPEEDIALVRLDQFDGSSVTEYPVFKNPNNPLRPGTSLCRLGYPLYGGEAVYDEAARNFDLPKPPFFPIEGIFTRTHILEKGGKKFQAIETSSPGLRGQSGGPIFDRQAVVWGIQQRTVHFDLGFSPDGSTGPKQYLHAGVGSHPEVLIPLLESNGIAFNKEQTNAT